MRKILFAVACFSIFTACDFENFVQSDRYKEDFNYSYDLKPGGTVTLESLNGAVEITGWEKNEVQISGAKYASTQELLSSLKVDIMPSADSVRIRVVRPSERRGGMGARFVLRVPRQARLDRIETSNGGIRIEGLEGEFRLRTSNGGVKIFKSKGPLEATTSNASIDVQDFDGSAVLHTSNGGIKADGVRGRFEADTSNAGIDARLTSLEPGRPVKAHTSNGHISLAFDAFKGNDVIADSSNGGITLRLPSDVSAQLNASTSNSSITTDFDVNVRGTQSKHRLEGTIGAGGPRIDLTTSNGSIRIARL